MFRLHRIVRLISSATRPLTFWKNSSSYFEPIIVRKMSETSVHPTAESGFSTSQRYDRARLGYSKETVNFLLEKLGILPQNPSWDQQIQVLELGAGTGKFTRTLQEVLRGSNNVHIIASEPHHSMRQEFVKNFPDIEIKNYSAENIDMPDSSVHAVIAAQSFHWFANEKSVSQIQRVLVPGGKLGMVWNSWDHSISWLKELNEELILPCYWEANAPYELSYEWKKVLDSSGKFQPVEGDESLFKSKQAFTFDELVDRVLSISVMQVKYENEKEILKEKIKFILMKHNEIGNKKLILPHIVKIYWSKRK